MTLIYCLEAKERVASLGAALVGEFINAAPANLRMNFFAQLPSIAGFRKGSQLQIKEQFKKLLHSLTHASDPRFKADGTEWVVLERFWLHWAVATFGDSYKAPDSMPGLQDESSTFKYFSDFVNRCGVRGCAKEDVQLLYRISGFPNSVNVDTLIDGLPTREVLNHRRELAQLPREVERAHGRLDDLESVIATLKKGLRGVETILAKPAESSVEANRLKTLEQTVRHLEEKLDGDAVSARKSVNAIAKGVEAAQATVDSNAGQMKSLAKAHKEIISAQLVLEELLAGVERSLEELSVNVDAKLKELKPQRRRIADEVSGTEVSTVLPNLIRVKAPKPVDNPALKDPKQALSLIASNISAVGVQAEMAEEVARAVLVAATCGQLVQFTGSLAETLALGICASLGGSQYIAWDVPLGLCDGAQVRPVLEAMRDETNRPGCLLIRGANKSAFEIYGDEVRQAIVSRQLELNDDLDVWPSMATWSDGPATLPGGVQLASLGPVINSDNLAWGRAKREKLRYAALDIVALSASLKLGVDADEVADLVRDLEELSAPFNQVRRRIVQRAASALLGLPDSDLTRSFNLAATYWGLPWAHALGISQSDMEGRIRRVSPKALDAPALAKGLSELVAESLN